MLLVFPRASADSAFSMGEGADEGIIPCGILSGPCIAATKGALNRSSSASPRCSDEVPHVFVSA